MLLQVFQNDSHTPKIALLCRCIFANGLMTMGLLEFLNLIEVPGALGERSGADLEHEFGVPSGLRSKSNNGASSDDVSIGQTHKVLVTADCPA